MSMADSPRSDLTALLDDARRGDAAARERLTVALYGEMMGRAASVMRQERPGHPLQRSEFAQEALIRLFASDPLSRARDRRYLFAAAAQAMRRVLVDHARKRN